MKTDFDIKWHLKVEVKYFGISGKPLRHFMMLHNNIGFNSKGSEDISTEITKNRRF